MLSHILVSAEGDRIGDDHLEQAGYFFVVPLLADLVAACKVSDVLTSVHFPHITANHHAVEVHSSHEIRIEFIQRVGMMRRCCFVCS